MPKRPAKTPEPIQRWNVFRPQIPPPELGVGDLVFAQVKREDGVVERSADVVGFTSAGRVIVQFHDGRAQMVVDAPHCRLYRRFGEVAP